MRGDVERPVLVSASAQEVHSAHARCHSVLPIIALVARIARTASCHSVLPIIALITLIARTARCHIVLPIIALISRIALLARTARIVLT